MDSKAPVVSQQPQGRAMPPYKDEQTGSVEWQHGLFDCCTGEDNLCLKATFCSCFVYGKSVARAKDPQLQAYERFNSDCFIFAAAQAFGGCGWILALMNRGETRQRYNINGGACTDCLAAYCCTCCSLIQVEKEIIARQSQGNAGYVAPAGMVAGPMQ